MSWLLGLKPIIKKSRGQKLGFSSSVSPSVRDLIDPRVDIAAKDGKRRYHHFNAPLFVTEHFVSFEILNTTVNSRDDTHFSSLHTLLVSTHPDSEPIPEEPSGVCARAGACWPCPPAS